MTTIKEKAREYAERECCTIGTAHLRGYVQTHYESGFQECARSVLAPLSEEELAAMSAAVEKERERDHLLLVEVIAVAFSALLKLRGVHG